jgi:hypothetical protein
MIAEAYAWIAKFRHTVAGGLAVNLGDVWLEKT